MIGLALEGGGARGAYHIGVIKAYLENGYEFDGFVGTSIGAMNAAILAQGEFQKAFEFWKDLSMEKIFDEDAEKLLEIGTIKLEIADLSILINSLRKIIDTGGVDTSKIRSILTDSIDEDKLRTSKKDFGLVTVSVTEGKPYELFLEDIPEGKLVNYIMASASFPGFKLENMGKNIFIDGGLFNNCPINMLQKKKYDEIIAVRTHAPGRFRNIKKYNHANITLIEPTEDLGNIMMFSKEQIGININRGYFDGLRKIKNLKGSKYYLDLTNSLDFHLKLMSIDDENILEIGKILGIKKSPPKRMLFENIIPQLGAFMKLKNNFDYSDFVIALLEHLATQRNVEIHKAYNIDEFIHTIKNIAFEVKIEEETLPILSLIQSKRLKAMQLMAESFVNL